MPRKPLSAKALARAAKAGKRGGLIGGIGGAVAVAQILRAQALTIKLTEEERLKKAALRRSRA